MEKHDGTSISMPCQKYELSLLDKRDVEQVNLYLKNYCHILKKRNFSNEKIYTSCCFTGFKHEKYIGGTIKQADEYVEYVLNGYETRCFDYYKTYDKDTPYCYACPLSSKYKNKNDEIEKLILGYALRNPECAKNFVELNLDLDNFKAVSVFENINNKKHIVVRLNKFLALTCVAYTNTKDVKSVTAELFPTYGKAWCGIIERELEGYIQQLIETNYNLDNIKKLTKNTKIKVPSNIKGLTKSMVEELYKELVLKSEKRNKQQATQDKKTEKHEDIGVAVTDNVVVDTEKPSDNERESSTTATTTTTTVTNNETVDVLSITGTASTESTVIEDILSDDDFLGNQVSILNENIDVKGNVDGNVDDEAVQLPKTRKRKKTVPKITAADNGQFDLFDIITPPAENRELENVDENADEKHVLESDSELGTGYIMDRYVVSKSEMDIINAENGGIANNYGDEQDIIESTIVDDTTPPTSDELENIKNIENIDEPVPEESMTDDIDENKKQATEENNTSLNAENEENMETSFDDDTESQFYDDASELPISNDEPDTSTENDSEVISNDTFMTNSQLTEKYGPLPTGIPLMKVLSQDIKGITEFIDKIDTYAWNRLENAILTDNAIYYEVISDEHSIEYMLLYLNTAQKFVSFKMSNIQMLGLLKPYFERKRFKKICFSAFTSLHILKKFNFYSERKIVCIQTLWGILYGNREVYFDPFEIIGRITGTANIYDKPFVFYAMPKYNDVTNRLFAKVNEDMNLKERYEMYSNLDIILGVSYDLSAYSNTKNPLLSMKNYLAYNFIWPIKFLKKPLSSEIKYYVLEYRIRDKEWSKMNEHVIRLLSEYVEQGYFRKCFIQVLGISNSKIMIAINSNYEKLFKEFFWHNTEYISKKYYSCGCEIGFNILEI